MLGLALGLIGLAGLLLAEQRDDDRTRLACKLLASIGFIVAALEVGVVGRYDWLVLLGLICGLIGDGLLAYTHQRAFLMGMIAFAVGHVLYIAAFSGLAGRDPFPPSVAVVVAMVSGAVLAWLWPYLGRMGVPVGVYMLLIGAMLVAALGTITVANASNRFITPVGAFLFWISDLFVARNAFVGRAFVNQAVGLPLYYAGQFLLAFSLAAWT